MIYGYARVSSKGQDRYGNGLDIIDDLLGRGVAINVLNMGKFDASPSGKLMRTIFLAFAEFERDLIVQRTSESKGICRESRPGWREGRKQRDIPDLEKFRQKQKDGELTVSECCRQLGISRST